MYVVNYHKLSLLLGNIQTNKMAVYNYRIPETFLYVVLI